MTLLSIPFHHPPQFLLPASASWIHASSWGTTASSLRFCGGCTSLGRCTLRWIRSCLRNQELFLSWSGTNLRSWIKFCCNFSGRTPEGQLLSRRIGGSGWSRSGQSSLVRVVFCYLTYVQVLWRCCSWSTPQQLAESVRLLCTPGAGSGRVCHLISHRLGTTAKGPEQKLLWFFNRPTRPWSLWFLRSCGRRWLVYPEQAQLSLRIRETIVRTEGCSLRRWNSKFLSS